MTISISLDSRDIPLPAGWQYSASEPENASFSVRFPREGRTAKYDGAIFTLGVLRIAEEDVVCITFEQPAGLWFDDAGDCTLGIRFDDELDVTFRAQAANERQAMIVVASSHLIALLTVSTTFEVKFVAADEQHIQIEADFGGPLVWPIR